MAFRGRVLTVGDLLAAPGGGEVEVAGGPVVGARHTAASNARRAGELFASGEPVEAGWRFGVLQTLDDYSSLLRRSDVTVASSIFTEEPAPTGWRQLDAAFAALADFLAERDGWAVPGWAQDPSRHAGRWYAAVPSIFRAEATAESPRAFRERGIFITSRSLARA